MAKKKRKSIPWGLPSSSSRTIRQRRVPPAEGGWTWTTRPPTDSKPNRYRPISFHPNPGNGAFNWGKESFRRREFDNAIRHFTRALQMNSRHAQAYRFRGDVYASLNQYDNALRDYGASIRIDPRNASAHFGRGVALYNMGRTDWLNASYAFMKAISLDPSLEQKYRQLPSKPSTDYDLAVRVDVDLVRRLRGRGRTWREVIEAHPSVRSSGGEILKPGLTSIQLAMKREERSTR